VTHVTGKPGKKNLGVSIPRRAGKSPPRLERTFPSSIGGVPKNLENRTTRSGEILLTLTTRHGGSRKKALVEKKTIVLRKAAPSLNVVFGEAWVVGPKSVGRENEKKFVLGESKVGQRS